jgi:hypothetical protein
MINREIKMIKLCRECHTESCMYSLARSCKISERESIKEDLELCQSYTGKDS